MQKKKDTFDIYRHLYSGTQLALTVLVLFFLGYWADNKLNTRPWLALCGAAAGFIIGMYNFIKIFYGRKNVG